MTGTEWALLALSTSLLLAVTWATLALADAAERRVRAARARRARSRRDRAARALLAGTWRVPDRATPPARPVPPPSRCLGCGDPVPHVEKLEKWAPDRPELWCSTCYARLWPIR